MSDAPCARPEPGHAPAMHGQEDILRLRDGGDLAAAFALVMARYQGRVYRLCVAFLRDPALAQDVAQESLVRVWRALPRYDGRAALSTFIYVITRNRCLTALGSRGTAASLSEPAVQAEMDRLATMDEQAGRDAGHALRQLVGELPGTTRRIVTLYYFEQESVAAVATLVGLPEGTVKTHLFRARRQLRERAEALGLGSLASWQQR